MTNLSGLVKWGASKAKDIATGNPVIIGKANNTVNSPVNKHGRNSLLVQLSQSLLPGSNSL